MPGIISKILKYGIQTTGYPKEQIDLSFVSGKPSIDEKNCTFCGECAAHCPSKAIVMDTSCSEIGINLDECIFCSLCSEVCPSKLITVTHEFELASGKREYLRKSPFVIEDRDVPGEEYKVLCSKIAKTSEKLFGRSLAIREVDSGSCNACDLEINSMNNPFNDLERFGIHFVASPRHADMLLITGTATRNMELALVKTYNATPSPKLVVAVGACACSGGIFRDSYATRNGIDCIVPVDVYIPGCPPRPQAIMFGILKALERI
jgi:Ni,Fe-hydrogenase III small subunit/formate hydrogenlyase subunit 6/NADH:ubiquinone oxidoreductase subunit I